MYALLLRKLTVDSDAKPPRRRKFLKKPVISDLIEIPLPDGRYGYGHYVANDSQFGQLLSVFNVVADAPLASEELQGVRAMFPAIFGPHVGEVQIGRWRVVGNLPVSNFEAPLFRCGMWNSDFKVGMWFLWDGRQEIMIGPTLPSEYMNLEMRINFGGEDVEKRIMNGGRLEWLDRIH